MQNLYSIDELAEKSGFSPRTIAYYIQMKLLPSIGRRGRKTKYPVEYLYRLQVIKRFKDKQNDNYLLMQYGLEDVAALLNCMTPEELKEYAVGKIRISEHTLKKILLKSSSEDRLLFRDVTEPVVKIDTEDDWDPSESPVCAIELPVCAMSSRSIPEDLESKSDQIEEPPPDEDKKLSIEDIPAFLRGVSHESYKPSKKRTDKKTTTSDAALQKELIFLRLNNGQLKEENEKLTRKNRELKDKLDVFITHINEVIIRHK